MTMRADEAVSLETLDVLARALHVKNAELQPTLDAIVAQAATTTPAAKWAGLLLVAHNELAPAATSGRPPHDLDLLQQRLRSGPCLDTAQQQAVHSIPNTATDERWPEVMKYAVSLGVGSMLCVPLWVDERTLGSLSLYADRPEAFEEHDLQTVKLFATLAALALSGAQLTEQLQAALRNRELIGQAKGILMERLRVTEDDAFLLLARASQNQNRKLVAVAQHLVDSGELPG
jgi:GAF domain-containing protein